MLKTTLKIISLTLAIIASVSGCSNSVVHSTGTVYNIEKSKLNSYIQKAKKGDLVAIKKLENFYFFIEEDSNKSIFYSKQAIKLYDSESLNNYLTLRKEEKKDNEIDKCIIWLESLAENNTFAQRELYKLYSEGKYINENSTKSDYFLKKVQDNLNKNSF